MNRLRAVEQELDRLEVDIFREPADWEVVALYPKVLLSRPHLASI